MKLAFFVLLAIAGIVLAVILFTPNMTPTLQSKAQEFGHQLAVSIEEGRFYSADRIYAMCSMTGQEKGYHGDDLERFINIAQRQAYRELK